MVTPPTQTLHSMAHVWSDNSGEIWTGHGVQGQDCLMASVHMSDWCPIKNSLSRTQTISFHLFRATFRCLFPDYKQVSQHRAGAGLFQGEFLLTYN